MSFVTSALLLAATATQAPTASGDPADFWWGDYDGDGLADALVHTPAGGTRLLRNQGDGTLEDVTVAAGLAGLLRPGFVLWADYDADGAGDLYIGSPETPGRLFQNQGGSFVDVTVSAGLQRTRGDLSAAWIDYDGDGLLDLHLSGMTGHSLFRNQGEAGFAATALPFAAIDEVEGGIVSSGAPEDPTAPPSAGGTVGGSSGRRDFGGPLGGAVGGGGLAAGGGGGPIIASGAVNPMPGNIFDCVNSLNDQAGGCLEASSTPTLGMLYPLSSDLFVDPSGRVGMGTVAPGYDLDVEGSIGGSEVYADYGSSSVPAFRFGGGAETTGLSSPVFEELAIITQGNERVRVDGAGRVGIGTTNPGGEMHVKSSGTLDVLFEGDTNTYLDMFSRWDARIRIEADTDNSFENDQPSVEFVQDGGLVESRVGYFESLNDFTIASEYDFADMHFKVPHITGTGNNFFEFHNTGTAGTTFDVEARLDEGGDWQIDGSVSSPAADLAEVYPVTGPIEPGDVVAFSGNGLSISRAQTGDEARLAGVISSQPAFIMGQSYTDEEDTGTPYPGGADADRFGGDTTPYRVNQEVLHEIQVNHRAPLALAGRVPVKITAENGAIQPGDLLTLSSIPGHAMRATETGLTIGTALEPWSTGEGKILAFVRTGWYAPGPDAGQMAAVQKELDDLRAFVGSELASIRNELEASAE